MLAIDHSGCSDMPETMRDGFDHRKWKRRRRRPKATPSSAWLKPNNKLKGDIGALSADLWTKLFGEWPTESEADLRYIAVSASFAATPDFLSEGEWTVLPVLPRSGDLPDDSLTLLCPASSSAYLSLYKRLDTDRLSSSLIDNARAEIKVLDVEPLKLDSILVTIDGDLLNKHFEVQKMFGGGFGTHNSVVAGKGKGRAKQAVNGDSTQSPKTSEEGQLTNAIREALASLYIVRQGNLLSLPLPTHPITHAAFPPAQITLCEPVSQGLMASSTKIILNREYGKGLEKVYSRTSLPIDGLSRFRLNEEDDSSNENFYSTVEEGTNGDAADTEDCKDYSVSSADSNGSQSLSDDSSDDSVSIGPPGFGLRTTVTAFRAGGSRSGATSPRGSIYSNYTATTARQNTQDAGRLFIAKPLMMRIPDEMLRPKPLGVEDDEARVYVDIKMLMKLGTFSGDWIRLQASQPDDNTWGTNFGSKEPSNHFRVGRIYGLSELSPARITRHSKGAAVRKGSGASTVPFFGRPTPEAWISPNLLANLGNPGSIRISPLVIQGEANSLGRSEREVPASSNPPKAKEITLRMVSAPFTTEKAAQVGIMASTKQYFQSKTRLLMEGDLIPIAFDIGSSRMLADSSTAPEADAQISELLSISLEDRQEIGGDLGVAWFRVVKTVAAESPDVSILAGTWGGAVHMDPSVTRTIQAGNETCRLPSPENGFEYYLGLKAAPKSLLNTNVLARATKAVPKIYVSPLRRRLRELVTAATSSRAVHFGLDPIIVLLHSGQRNVGKATIATQSVSDLGLHTFNIDAYELLTEGSAGGDVKTEGIFQARVERALSCGAQYTAIVVRHIEALTAPRMVTALKDAISSSRILIATTTESESLPDSLRSIFTHELELSAPDESEREGLLHNIILDRGLRLSPSVDISSVALKSAALVAGDLVDIVDRAATARQVRLEALLASNAPFDHQVLIRDILLTGDQSVHSLTPSDFESALATARKSFAASIGAPKIPSVAWSDVGGLAHIKDSIIETIQLPLNRPELFARGMKKRSGILFYGPPGTGKTLLAKAIATEFSLNFFSVKGPELLNMYIGESEANVRRVFQKARDARPCVVFFDELDSVAPKRGNQGDSGGVMDRIVSQLLAELDGMSDREDGARGGVFVIGATNRPDLLDQALLRPGRFDKMLYLGIPDSHEKQFTILQALTRKFTLAPECSLARVAASLPFTYTGADLYALASDAMLKAITRKADAVDAKIKALPGGEVSKAYFFDHLATEQDVSVTVTEQDFEIARMSLVGSVSAKELEHYKRVREAFEGNEVGGRKGPMLTRRGNHLSGGAGKAKAKDVLGGERESRERGWSSSSSDEDEDEAYETSRDFQSPARGGGFREGDVEDEDEIYA